MGNARAEDEKPEGHVYLIQLAKVQIGRSDELERRVRRYKSHYLMPRRSSTRSARTIQQA